MEDPIEDESDNSARKEVTKTPWQYGLRSSKVFVVAVITIAIFTVSIVPSSKILTMEIKVKYRF